MGAPTQTTDRRARFRDSASEHRQLLAGSAALVVGAAVQAVSGAVFWLVAARIDATDDVGRATALFTSVLFLAYVVNLGLPVSLARFAPARDRVSHVVFAWASIVTSLAAAVAAFAYLLVVETEATAGLLDWHAVGGPAIFCLAAVGTALSLIVDVRLMTVRRWSLVLWRIGLVGLGRFPLLLFPTGGAESVHLFVVAVAPLAVSGFVGVALMPSVSGQAHRLSPRPPRLWSWLRYSAVNYLSTLAYQGPQFVLPVIVLVNVEPEANASFYVAFGITAVALYVPMAIGQALLAEGGKDGAHLLGQVRVVLSLGVALMALATVATVVGRDVLTLVYGPDYRDAADVLPLLVAGTVPWAVTSVFLTEARVLHRHGDTVAITGTLTAAMFLPAVILVPREGLTGAGASFLFGNVVAAAVAVFAHWRGRRAERSLRRVPEPEPELVIETLHP